MNRISGYWVRSGEWSGAFMPPQTIECKHNVLTATRSSAVSCWSPQPVAPSAPATFLSYSTSQNPKFTSECYPYYP